ncbi:MAG: PASTA domain-containing protein [Ilumatobacteraceae bacterium]|nr:PASTA domain-containing protein [Ilumatobacteraceae bacterium]
MDENDPTEPHADDPDLLVGSLVGGRFRVTGLSTAGSTTWIYSATDETSGRTVTLKVIRPGAAVAADFAVRFDDTMRAVAALSHPNIAAVYDWGRVAVGDGTTVYVATEALSGGSLRDMYDRGRRLSPSQALAVGLEACRGLDHAHRRGFVHTELTPSKLVFGDDRRLRIVDLGLAGLLNEAAWLEPPTVATHVARYASPEQALAQPVDGRTDVYALTLSLVEGVTGSLPFEADSTVATLAARIGRLMPVSADLGPLAAVFERAGRPDPAERSTAAELGTGLVQAAEKLPRPEPLPLLSSSMFDTPVTELRAPDDPTGGLTRPFVAAAAADALVVVPVDEPDSSPAAPEPEPIGELEPEPVAGPEPEPEPEPGPAPDPEPLVVVPLDADVTPDAEPAVTPDAEPSAVPVEPAATVESVEPVATVRRRRRRWPWVVVAIALVGALVGLGVLAYRLFVTPTHVVPDLVGVEREAALEAIEGFDWELVERTERSDDEPRPGHVVRTTPAAGIDLAEGEPFVLVVSEGPVLRTIAELAGRPAVEVQAELVEQALEPVLVEVPDEVVPAGTVVSWVVPDAPGLTAGGQVEPGTVVEVTVSTGPAPRTVPSLVGLTVDEARAAVEPLGLGVAPVGDAFSDTVEAGRVLEQSPLPESLVSRGTTIELVVSKGPDLVPLPDVSGRVYDEAAQVLTEAGLVPRLLLGASDGTVISVRVDGEPVAAGTPLRRGTQVDLIAV